MKNVVIPKKRVALYVRVSTTEQAEKYGKDAQLSQMKKWIAANEDLYTFNEKHVYIDENFSGASEIEERKELPKLFEAARKKEFDVVLVWKVDRFFRKTRALLNAIEELKAMGIGFISTTQTEINTTSTMGKFMLGLLGIIAEMERDLIMERTAIGRMEAAKKNKYVGGMHTYGYNIDPKTQELKINPETSKVVRKVFHWFVKKRWTTYQIQKQLNAMNIPTQADLEDRRLKKEKSKSQKKGKKRQTNPENYWHDSTVGRILRNEAYTGKYYFGKKTRRFDQETKKWQEIKNPEEEWIPLTCPQIIDKGTWKLAKAILKLNARTQKVGKHTYLLSGIVVCGRCGSPYGGYMQPKHKTKNGKRELVSKLPHYRCRRSNWTKGSKRCMNRQISGTILEEGAWAQVKELLSNPTVFMRRIEEEERKRVNVKELEERRDENQKTIDELDKEFERVTLLFQKGMKYTRKGELEKEVERITAEKLRLVHDQEAIAAQLLDAEEKRERLASVKDLGKKYLHALDNLDFETKRTILHDLIKRIVIDGEEIRLELQIPSLSGRKGGNKVSNLYGATGRNRTSDLGLMSPAL